MDDSIGDLSRGAAAGLAGTAVMTAALAAAKAAGATAGELPPRQTARNAAEAAGLRDDLTLPQFEAGWLALHFVYGAAAGVGYEAVRRVVNPRGPWAAGAAYGAALWALGYAGWVPAFGLKPPPTQEPRRKVATEVVTHLIYGVTTAMASHALRP